MTSVNTTSHICLFPCFLFSATDSKFSPLGRKGEISVEFQNVNITSDLKITGRLRHFPDHRARESSKQERAYDTLGSGVISGLPAGAVSLHVRHADKKGIRRGYQAYLIASSHHMTQTSLKMLTGFEVMYDSV